jgi:hypothetical protein
VYFTPLRSSTRTEDQSTPTYWRALERVASDRIASLLEMSLILSGIGWSPGALGHASAMRLKRIFEEHSIHKPYINKMPGRALIAYMKRQLYSKMDRWRVSPRDGGLRVEPIVHISTTCTANGYGTDALNAPHSTTDRPRQCANGSKCQKMVYEGRLIDSEGQSEKRQLLTGSAMAL